MNLRGVSRRSDPAGKRKNSAKIIANRQLDRAGMINLTPDSHHLTGLTRDEYIPPGINRGIGSLITQGKCLFQINRYRGNAT